ncbi:MAG: hypothetical protein Aurels2KO_09340 [Aureliella sp.]
MLLADLPTIPFLSVLAVAAAVTLGVIALGGLFILATSRRHGVQPGRNLLAKLCYVVFIAVVAVLSASSFGSMVQFGHMSGYALLAHIGASGAFVFLLLAIAYFYLPRGEDSLPDGRWWVARWSAWGLVVGGIVAAGTMFLSMLPILGTDGLQGAAEVHRYGGMVAALSACVHFFALCCVKLGVR